MIASLARSYSISVPDEIQLVSGVIAVPTEVFIVNFVNQYNINFPWPNTANSIVKQLTQLFPHMFIQAYTDYWNVRLAVS